MKKLLSIITVYCILIYGCDKNGLTLSNGTDVAKEAQLKVNFFSIYRANPGYQVKINEARVSNVLTYATPFPGGGLNTLGGSTSDYLAVSPGQAKIAISFPKSGTNEDSLKVSDTTVTLEASKKYSLYFADTAAKMVKVLVADTLVRPDSGYAKYKFVNLIPDVAALDLYIGSTIVATNIPYKGVSASFVLPTNNQNTTWAIKLAGSTSASTALNTYAGTTSIGNQRVYTVVARGYASLAGTDPRRKMVSLVINQ